MSQVLASVPAASPAAVETSRSKAVMVGYAAVFDPGLRWQTFTEIRSSQEGHFLERIQAGAFQQSISKDRVVVLFQHGQDSTVGNKPIGKIRSLYEDNVGLAYEVDLFTESLFVRELLQGLRENAYGASFRFSTIRESFDPRPPRSAHNPQRIPERTLEEVRLFEFGPVTFGAYPTATAGLRSSQASATRPRLTVVSSPPPAKPAEKPFALRFVNDPRSSK